jgi:hypothetical protein
LIDFSKIPANQQEIRSSIEHLTTKKTSSLKVSTLSSIFYLLTELKALIPGYAPAPDRRNLQMLHQQQPPLQQQQPLEMEPQEFSGRGFYVEQQMMPQMQGMQSIKSRKPQQH